MSIVDPSTLLNQFNYPSHYPIKASMIRQESIPSYPFSFSSQFSFCDAKKRNPSWMAKDANKIIEEAASNNAVKNNFNLAINTDIRKNMGGISESINCRIEDKYVDELADAMMLELNRTKYPHNLEHKQKSLGLVPFPFPFPIILPILLPITDQFLMERFNINSL